MITLDDWLIKMNDYMAGGDVNGYKARVELIAGKKYHKIVRVLINEDGERFSRSAIGFIDQDGNIYKAATWSAPAKHIRGNIHTSPNNGVDTVVGYYSVAYLR